MTLKTCTKVNVGLNVLRKRPDGYHDLETLFVPYYGYSDILTVEPAASLGITIEREGGVDWDPMDDLTIKAWRLLKSDFPKLPEVSIHLEKHAPVGAGLGGGSADAAFMLKALNELGSLGLDNEALAGYASKLGSDCAFFIYSRPMFATGRGEVLEPFDIDLSGFELKVEIPTGADGAPVAVSTREAYGGIIPRDRWEKREEDCLQPHVRKGQNRLQTAFPPLRDLLHLPVEQWRGKVVNDFESTVCPLHPDISELIADFYARGSVYAAMSGSGSSVFGLFR